MAKDEAMGWFKRSRADQVACGAEDGIRTRDVTLSLERGWA